MLEYTGCQVSVMWGLRSLLKLLYRWLQKEHAIGHCFMFYLDSEQHLYVYTCVGTAHPSVDKSPSCYEQQSSSFVMFI